MKIGGHFITSLSAYRKHFDFYSVWKQISIFLRDMAPTEVPYLKDAKKDKDALYIYEAIACPNRLKLTENALVYISDGNDEIQLLKSNDLSFLNLESISEYKLEDKLRMALLCELADRNICSELGSSNIGITEHSDYIVLNNGSTINLVDYALTGRQLYLKPITVDKHSTCSSIIGDYELLPDKFVIGVFSESGLHKILNPIAQNETYLLKITGDTLNCKMSVLDKVEDTISYFDGVSSFCSIGNEDFAYVTNNRVYLYNNYGLHKLINSQITILDAPLYIEVDNNKLVITMKDGSRKDVSLS